MKSVLIVGAGISGLVASLILLKKGYKVTLCEASAKVGGLLGQSYKWRSCHFDHGTHFIASTGNKEHDALLFGVNFEMTKAWNNIPLLLAGNYFAQRLNENSPVIDLRHLPDSIYQQISAGFLTATANINALNLDQQLRSTLGDCACDQVFAPLMMKLYGQPLSRLDVQSHQLFGLSRVTLTSADMALQLKQLAYFDDFLAYDHRTESLLKVFYPSTGVEGWVMSLLEQCQAFEAFRLHLQTQVTRIERGGLGLRVCFNRSDLVNEFSNMVWTAPNIPLAKLLDLDMPNTFSVKFRRADLYHFVFDEPFRTELHYVTCYQHDMHSFRVTLYSNFNPCTDGYYCTVEVLRDFDEPSVDTEIVVKELEKMGLCQGGIVHQHQQQLNTGFPVRSVEFIEAQQSIRKAITMACPEVLMLGKNNTNSFFMKDVIHDTISIINSGVI